MNWYDYTRGYDDGQQDGYTADRGGGLFLSLLHFAFSMLVLLLKLCWFIFKGLAGLILGIIGLIAGRNR